MSRSIPARSRAYFAALEEERVIAADDAHADPRTAEFSEIYLTPLGVNSPARAWTTTEQQFTSALADFIALAIESHDRQRTETELREMVEVAEQRLQTIERQRLAIADLSAPIIDVWDGILALPIVDVVDTMTANHLLQMIRAAGLLGTDCVLSGISPQIAQESQAWSSGIRDGCDFLVAKPTKRYCMKVHDGATVGMMGT